jgi:hypothetical protein
MASRLYVLVDVGVPADRLAGVGRNPDDPDSPTEHAPAGRWTSAMSSGANTAEPTKALDIPSAPDTAMRRATPWVTKRPSVVTRPAPSTNATGSRASLGIPDTAASSWSTLSGQSPTATSYKHRLAERCTDTCSLVLKHKRPVQRAHKLEARCRRSGVER